MFSKHTTNRCDLILTPSITQLHQLLTLSTLPVNTYIMEQPSNQQCLHESTLLFDLIIMKVLILVTLLGIGLSVIHVEPQRNVQTVSVRLGEQAEISYPNYPFKFVYSRDITRLPTERRPYKINEICDEAPSQMALLDTAFFGIEPPRPKRAVIYELEDIIGSQTVVDAAILRQSVFVAFQNGTVLTLRINTTNETIKSFGLKNLTNNGEQIPNGVFVINLLNDMVLFVTDKAVYFMRDGSYEWQAMVNFRPVNTVYNAIIFQNKYLVLAQGSAGIVFYQIISNMELKYLSTYGASSLGRDNIQIEDLAHNFKQVIFILDVNYGLNMIEVRIDNGKVKTTLKSQVLKKKNCDNIIFSKDDVYMTCGKVYKYGVFSDTIETELEDPRFKVRELYNQGNTLVVMGTNDFKVYVNDRLVDDIEVDNMDKFLLYKNHYIAVNQYGITYGNYTLKPPVISCHTNDPGHQGVYNVLVTTEAECSVQYLAKRDIHLDSTIGQTCLYTTPVQLIFWSPRDLTLLPFIIVFCLFAALLITTLIWIIMVKRREWKLKNALLGFHMPGTKSSYDVMVEQAPNQADIVGKDKPAAQPQTKPADQQYDIGD